MFINICSYCTKSLLLKHINTTLRINTNSNTFEQWEPSVFVSLANFWIETYQSLKQNRIQIVDQMFFPLRNNHGEISQRWYPTKSPLTILLTKQKSPYLLAKNLNHLLLLGNSFLNLLKYIWQCWANYLQLLSDIRLFTLSKPMKDKKRYAL